MGVAGVAGSAGSAGAASDAGATSASSSACDSALALKTVFMRDGSGEGDPRIGWRAHGRDMTVPVLRDFHRYFHRIARRQVQSNRHKARGSCCTCMTRPRSEEHTSELQSLMRISYAVFCLKKKKRTQITNRI